MSDVSLSLPWLGGLTCGLASTALVALTHAITREPKLRARALAYTQRLERDLRYLQLPVGGARLAAGQASLSVALIAVALALASPWPLLGSSLALGRRASELCAGRFEQLCHASDPADIPLQELLRKMCFDAMSQASFVEPYENQVVDEGRLSSRPQDGFPLIRGYLSSLSKSLGEGPLHRDAALFYAETLEEEASRLFRVLAGHSRESRAIELFTEMAEHQKGNFQFLREVVLEG